MGRAVLRPWRQARMIGLGCVLTLSVMAHERPRIVVLTDISNEPDDEESLVRFLVYANEFEIEGLIATTSTWLRQGPREDLIRRHLQAYGAVLPNLKQHADGFPDAALLAERTFTGQPGYGMAFVGADHRTPGAEYLAAVAARADEQPLWVSVWGGANTLAQALWQLRSSLPPAELAAVVRRLRVYAISDQDDAGAWIRREFPELMYIVSPSTQDSHEYWRATWTGISGDRFYKNGPGHHFALVENDWLETNVIRAHGALGALYPKWEYIMEGDTPAFLGLIQNGLGWQVSPAYGGWGGRYVLYRATGESRPIWTNNDASRDTVTAVGGETFTSDPATIWRWRQHYQHDFAARMDWCVAERYAEANHNPLAVLNGDRSRQVLELSARGGEELRLSAAGTTDPDGDAVRMTWWIYPEAGSVDGATLTAVEGESTSLRLPSVERAGTVHVILQVEDSGAPSLWSYRRVVVSVQP